MVVPGEPKIRGKVNVVLNGLVREGGITDFRTNFDIPDAASGFVVTVTAAPSRSLKDVREYVFDALAAAAIGIDIIVEWG